MKRIIRLAVLVVLARLSVVASAQVPDPNFQTVKAILDLPEDQIDLARAMVSIDHMIDPTIDIENALKQLDAFAADILPRLSKNASSSTKKHVLWQYIFGEHHDQEFLSSSYLATRYGDKGGALFVILEEKLGVDMFQSDFFMSLQSKNKKEVVATFASGLHKFYVDSNQNEKATALENLRLKYGPATRHPAFGLFRPMGTVDYRDRAPEL